VVALHESSGETSGRIVFGAFAVIVALVAACAWRSFAKALIGSLRHD
jgi:hypothetical protein